MIITKIMIRRRLQHRLWILWSLTCFILSLVTVAWAQFPTGPPPPSLFGAQLEGVAATSDVVADFTLNGGSVLSGQVRDANGMDVFSGIVFAQSATDIYSGPIAFDFDPANPAAAAFRYRIVLPDGTYNMIVNMFVFDVTSMDGQLLSVITFDLPDMVVVSGDTVRDLTVPAPPPFFNVTGQVTSLGMLPSEGSLRFQSQDGRVWNLAQSEIAEGATNATYQVTLPAGMYDVTYFATLPELPMIDPNNPTPPPPPDPEVPQQAVFIPVGTVMVGADQVFDITVPATVNLSGVLQDGMGTALAGSTIFAVEGLPVAPPDPPMPPDPAPPTPALCQAGAIAAAPFTAGGSAMLPQNNTLGQYAIPLVPGDYDVAVLAAVGLMPPASVPPGTLAPQEGSLTFPFPPDMISIAVDQVQDYTLPALPNVVLVSGRVVDQQNQPVGNASVSAVSSMITTTPNVLFSNSVTANEMGDYQLLVLSGVDYSILVCPPAVASPANIPAIDIPRP